MRAAAANDKHDRSALWISLPENRAKFAATRSKAQQRRDFQLSRQIHSAQAASRSSAPISTAATASRLRAPRSLSRVATSRVTRLIAAKAFKWSAPDPGGESSRKTKSTDFPSIAL